MLYKIEDILENIFKFKFMSNHLNFCLALSLLPKILSQIIVFTFTDK